MTSSPASSVSTDGVTAVTICVGHREKWERHVQAFHSNNVPNRFDHHREHREHGVFDLTERVIGAAIEVHRELGPGLLESTYEACTAHELRRGGIRFERQRKIPVVYKDVRLDCGYRIDLIVESSVIVEIKSVERLDPIHSAQVLTYMKLAGYRIGLIINFNVRLLKQGIRRFVL